MNLPLLRRIGAFSDVHGDAVALKIALEWFQNQALDAILCCGDLMDGPGDANRCCDLLRLAPIPTVRGNHDLWFLRGWLRDLPDAWLAEELSPVNRRWLENLPSTLRYQTVRGALLLCHGLGENEMACVRSGDYGYALEANLELQNLISGREFSLILNGHTHQTMARSFGELTILNPGALSRAHGGWCAVFDLEAGLAHWMQTSDGEICSKQAHRFE